MAISKDDYAGEVRMHKPSASYRNWSKRAAKAKSDKSYEAHLERCRLMPLVTLVATEDGISAVPYITK